MKITKNKVAALLGLLISVPTVVEGTLVLTGGSRPDQIILPWLVMYNVGMALFSFYVIREIWRNSDSGRKLSPVVLSAHFIVLLVLLGIYFTSGQVMVKSIGAMTMRSIIWGVINYLIRRRAA